MATFTLKTLLQLVWICFILSFHSTDFLFGLWQTLALVCLHCNIQNILFWFLTFFFSFKGCTWATPKWTPLPVERSTWEVSTFSPCLTLSFSYPSLLKDPTSVHVRRLFTNCFDTHNFFEGQNSVLEKQKCTVRPEQQEEQQTQVSDIKGLLNPTEAPSEFKYSWTASLTALNCFLMVRFWRKFLMRFQSHGLMCAVTCADNISTGRVPVEKTCGVATGACKSDVRSTCCARFFYVPWLLVSLIGGQPKKPSVQPNILRRSKARHHAGSFMKAIYQYLTHMYEDVRCKRRNWNNSIVQRKQDDDNVNDSCWADVYSMFC